VFHEIVERGEDRERAQRFVLQRLVALVAEDIGLLPEQLVSELLHECAEQGSSSYDLIGGLFRQMASEKPAPGGRYQGVQYFNGGLIKWPDFATALLEAIKRKLNERSGPILRKFAGQLQIDTQIGFNGEDLLEAASGEEDGKNDKAPSSEAADSISCFLPASAMDS